MVRMVFSSINFIFTFLPIFLIAYYFTPAKFKNAVLLTGSIVFYALGDKYYTFLLIGSLLVNYLLGRTIGDNSQYPSKRKMWFVIAMIFNFGMLVFFKYTNFLIENINVLLNTFSIGSLPKVNIVSPLGISFYVFQIVSYIADVYMGKQKAVYNIVNLGTYLCMFPRITMGPIVQYSEQAMELRTKKISILSLEDGLKTFIIGLGSKVLLANPMGTLWAGMSRYGYESISSPYAWLGAFAYSFQIYFDFAGYSLMAMGLGKMIGFTIPQNFNHPYISGSISEFWRRWHMTLGRWFKNYLYFPLGGSRCSKAKMIRNTFIVWAFTGLWHGASWNFVLWGLIFFVLIILEKLVLGKFLERTHILKHVYVIFIIPLTWVVFAITDIGDIGAYFSRLFPFLSSGTADFVNTKDVIRALQDYWYILLASIVFCLPFPAKIYKKYKNNIILAVALVAVFLYSVYKLATTSSNPFLYANF